MLVIFLTVFIDLIGFGIVVPLVPMYSRIYGASGWLIGAIIASFSAMQFIFSPIWGRLSDRYGRRPILLISTAGAALSYVLFAIGSGISNPHLALGVLLVSRMFAGACGGNITVAQAYIADITPPENRSKRMGLIGMAFGLGFIFGPAISGVALKFGGSTAPGWTAAALCAANFVLAFSILAESLRPDSGHANHRPRFAQWAHTLAQPKIGLLILIFFLATFAFSCFFRVKKGDSPKYGAVPFVVGTFSSINSKTWTGSLRNCSTVTFWKPFRQARGGSDTSPEADTGQQGN